MKLLSAVQEIILSKNINSIKYENGLMFPYSKSSLSKKLDIDYWSMIEAPPSNDSRETTSDLTRVIQLANNRIKKDIELVLVTDKNPLTLFEPIIKKYGLNFPHKEFAQLYTFLLEIIKDIKYFYNRARPYQLAKFYNQEIDVIHTDSHKTPSYPSGHTAYAALIASILSDKYPQYTDEFWEIVNICGLARSMQGVHYPGDNEASIKMIKRVYKPLRDFNSQFSQKHNN
jgi:hypothetical protein